VAVKRKRNGQLTTGFPANVKIRILENTVFLLRYFVLPITTTTTTTVYGLFQVNPGELAPENASIMDLKWPVVG